MKDYVSSGRGRIIFVITCLFRRFFWLPLFRVPFLSIAFIYRLLVTVCYQPFFSPSIVLFSSSSLSYRFFTVEICCRFEGGDGCLAIYQGFSRFWGGCSIRPGK